MFFDTPIRIGEIEISNRLVMPPMQTNKTDRGHVTAELVQYYHDRAVYSRPGIIITEHSRSFPWGQILIPVTDQKSDQPEILRSMIPDEGYLSFDRSKAMFIDRLKQNYWSIFITIFKVFHMSIPYAIP